MLRYEYLNKQWIVSPMARVVYRTAAALSLLLIPVLWVAFGGGMLGPPRPTAAAVRWSAQDGSHRPRYGVFPAAL